MSQYTQLTQLISDWQSGDQQLLEKIVPAVYDELHRVARSKMRGQSPQHTLQATALVNEAFCRIGSIDVELNDRNHFVGIVANLMRQILVEHARAKAAAKRGGDLKRVEMDDGHAVSEGVSIDLLAVEAVLESMEAKFPQKVKIAELYYFCGMTYAETAEALNLSEATVHRDLKFTKAMLSKRLASS